MTTSAYTDIPECDGITRLVWFRAPDGLRYAHEVRAYPLDEDYPREWNADVTYVNVWPGALDGPVQDGLLPPDFESADDALAAGMECLAPLMAADESIEATEAPVKYLRPLYGLAHEAVAFIGYRPLDGWKRA